LDAIAADIALTVGRTPMVWLGPRAEIEMASRPVATARRARKGTIRLGCELLLIGSRELGA
jgi:hypothetical protein